MSFFVKNLDIEKSDTNTVIHPSIKFLKLQTSRDGCNFFYFPLDTDVSKRKISDIIYSSYCFYSSKVPYENLVVMQYGDIKKKASYLYKKRGYVLWKDLMGCFKFKELSYDYIRDDTIELILDYNCKEDL